MLKSYWPLFIKIPEPEEVRGGKQGVSGSGAGSPSRFAPWKTLSGGLTPGSDRITAQHHGVPRSRAAEVLSAILDRGEADKV